MHKSTRNRLLNYKPVMLTRLIIVCHIFLLTSQGLLLQARTMQPPDSLEIKIQKIISNKQLLAGVSVQHLGTGYTLAINNDFHYPMQSVYKFHLALCVLLYADSNGIPLDQPLHIQKKDLLPDTWSPLRDRYPDGNISLPLYEIIRYTVSESDNNGCDILFRYSGGTASVNRCIQRFIPDISIAATEEEMHSKWEIQYENWCTPSSASDLLAGFFRKQILKGNSYDTLWKYMVESVTGSNRIKGLLPTGTVVAHKTGSSGTGANGIIAATNDIGIIELPDGQHIALAVFITNSKENNKINEQTIAEIARCVYDHFYPL